MSSNSLGKILKLTTFGESHGIGIGGILDGMPSGIQIDLNQLEYQLSRRRPGQSNLTTTRKESDRVNILSGLFEGITTGHPIGFVIYNQDAQSNDYKELKDVYRPSHADFTYQKKYGIRDHRGSGRASARETANWVVGGSIARQLIPEIEVLSFVSSIGTIQAEFDLNQITTQTIDSSLVRCPESASSHKMIELIEKTKLENDSVGGIITTIVKNMPIGLGEPVMDKLSARLAQAMMTIPATKGFEIGDGFLISSKKGSEVNDEWTFENKTKTNNSGGIQGGISNGMDLVFRTAFKPASTISKPQNTINKENQSIILESKGRHDPCVVPRAVPIIDALTYLVLADFFLINKTRKI